MKEKEDQPIYCPGKHQTLLILLEKKLQGEKSCSFHNDRNYGPGCPHSCFLDRFLQVDGEPCRLQPSHMVISLRNQVCMLQRFKQKRTSSQQTAHAASQGYSGVGDLMQSLPFSEDLDIAGANGERVRGMSVSPQPPHVSPPVESARVRSRSANNSPVGSPHASPSAHRRVISAQPHLVSPGRLGQVSMQSIVAISRKNRPPLSVTPNSGLSSSSDSEHFVSKML